MLKTASAVASSIWIWIFVFLYTSLLAEARLASAQRLADVDVQRAIEAGERRNMGNLVSQCTAGAGYREKVRANASGGVQPVGAFSVFISTNLGRISFLAAEAKRLKQPFGVSDVSDELRDAAVYVFVDPQEPASHGKSFGGEITWVPAAIDTVVLRGTNRSMVIRPAMAHVDSVSFKVSKRDFAFSGTLERVRALASYSIDEVRMIPGDLEIVVLTQAGERSCNVGGGERKRLLQ